MYLAASPFSNRVPIAWATSSPFQARVTFWRFGSSTIRSKASRPMKSWSNLTNSP
jgi:hypothetical protein